MCSKVLSIVSDPCTDHLFWRDHSRLGIHFFDYPEGHVFHDGDSLPDRSGYGHTIRLRTNATGASLPTVAVDDGGLPYLRMDDNVLIVVEGHTNLCPNSFTLELYANIEAPTRDFLVHDQRHLRFPYFASDGHIWIKSNTQDLMAHDDEVYHVDSAFGQTLHMVFSKMANYKHVTMFNNSVRSMINVDDPFTTTTGDIMIGGGVDGVARARGSLYYVRLTDKQLESSENLNVYQCEC